MSYLEKLKLLTSKRPLKLEKPKVIQFPVIDICNSKCQMCKIWENKQSNDITVEKLKRGLSNGLFSEVTSIGFNGGEPTLRSDLTELVQVAIQTLPKLESISLITNAYNYQDVIAQIEAIGKLCQRSQIHFDLMVSLDGYGEIHDLVRGKKDNFKRAQFVIQYAKESNLIGNLRIGCTVIRSNVYHLADLLDFCIANNIYIKYRLGVPHQRLYTKDLRDPYALTEAEKYEFVEFLEGLIHRYEKKYLQSHFYRSLIDQILYHAPRKAGCDWQHKGATITAKGELAYCAVKSKALMEDISVGNPEMVYFTNKSHLDDIIKNECDNCSHDYVGSPNRKEYLKFILFTLNSKFQIKQKLKSLPGIEIVQALRNRRSFTNYYRHYSNLPLLPKQSLDNTKLKKIIICGWYGTETLGDKAIIAGIIDSLQSIFGTNELSISVASLYPYISKMTKSQMVEFNDVDIVNLKDAVTHIAEYDYLLFGGGPMMAINDLAPMQVLFEKAKKANVTTIASGVGVGPLGKEWLNQSIKKILQNSDIRIYRDQKSLELAKNLGIDTTSDTVAEDPALTWLKKFQSTDVFKKSSDKKEKVLLLGLRDFPYKDYAKELNEIEALEVKNNYEASVIEALEKLVTSDSTWKIIPLPMCTNHFGDDDRWFYRQLFRGNEVLKSHLDYSLLGRELPPADYIEAFQKADILLGMRFHSVVFGLGLGTKTVAIDYTMGRGKVKSLSDRFGIQAISMLNMNSQIIIDAINDAYTGKTSQAKNICDGLLFESSLQKALNAIEHR